MKDKAGPKKGRRVIVLGAGFGGLEFCKKFSYEEAEIIVIDRQNHHLFQPLLYQVASAGLSAPEIAQPVRQILSGRKDISIILDEVLAIDLNKRKVRLRESDTELIYDYLIIALGAQTNYFGNDRWSVYSHGLKTLDDATRIRHRVLLAFEKAEYAGNAAIRERLMTIVVIGGGPTGVELAGAFAELVRHVFKKDFRHIDPSKARIILIEAAPRILLSFPERLAARGREQLEKLGVEIRTGAEVNDIKKGKVILENEIIEAENIIWSAGVCANRISRELNVDKDKSGRIKVCVDLTLPGCPNVFAVGDIAALVDAKGRSVPGVSPAAMQMGNYVAKGAET
jgi:NADH dehydrogenase